MEKHNLSSFAAEPRGGNGQRLPIKYIIKRKKVRTKGFLLGVFYWDRRSLLSDAPKEVNPEACGLRPVTNGV